MKYFKRGDEVIVQHENDEYSLKTSVNMLAMCLFEDFICFKNGEVNSKGK